MKRIRGKNGFLSWSLQFICKIIGDGADFFAKNLADPGSRREGNIFKEMQTLHLNSFINYSFFISLLFPPGCSSLSMCVDTEEPKRAKDEIWNF